MSHTVSLATAAVLTTLAALPPGTAGERTPPEGIYRDPQRALDPRIDPGKVTEHEPPPLPQRILLPVPAEFRIATDPVQVPIRPDHWEKARAAIDRGLEWLLSAQDRTGGWMAHVQSHPTDRPDQPAPVSVAVTALAVKAIAQARLHAGEDAAFRRAVDSVRLARRPDGSFEGGSLTNYVTATVVMALASMDPHDFHDEIQDAVIWLRENQWEQGEGLAARQDWFGGAGYGERGRPDLSNTQTMLDALHEAGLSPDEPSVQKALSFVSRAQNLRATNKAAWAGDDGGFVYTPANGGESFASEAAGEGRHGELVQAGQPRSLRSYGSMTYAGFKSMLHAGLSPDDVRVRAAFDWIRRNWTFQENPGLGPQGLYYYYHTMARALRAAQQDVITDLEDRPHNWREELIDALVGRQRGDGSWKNTADRWLEGEPVMATVYALLALEEAIKPVPGAPGPD
jgi:squalene-hopene/tetraprenyl-beta-curcumene cyclase